MGYTLTLAVILSGNWSEPQAALPSPAFPAQHWIANDLADDIFQLGEHVLGYGIWTCGGSSNCFELRDHPSRDVKDRVLDGWLRSFCSADGELPPAETSPPLDFE